MQRMQVQLTPEQLDALRAQAARGGSSISALVRRAVYALIRSEAAASPAERTQRALEAVGRYSSGQRDLSERHDDYLADAYRS